MKSKEFIKEDGGVTSASIATTVPTLGEKGGFSQKDMNKKLKGYTNQLSPGGIVKGVNSSKAN